MQILSPEVNRILYVSNLPPTVTGEDLYNLFGEFGSLRQVRVGDTPQTKTSAFVVFDDIYDAKKAVDQLSGFRLSKSKYLQVIYYDEERHKKQMDKKRKRKEQLAEFTARQEAEAQKAATVLGTTPS